MKLNETLRELREAIHYWWHNDVEVHRSFTVHLPVHVAQQLQLRAAEECRTKSEIVTDALVAYGHRPPSRVLRFPRA